MSDTIDNPHRRRLLASATAALTAGAVIATMAHAAVPSPSGSADADLIALCARRDADHLGLVEEIAEIRATTRAGLCAKAQVMHNVLDTGAVTVDYVDAQARHRLMRSLTRDVLAIVGRAA